ncbi:hypothetical protein KsCSTR_32580 [Candidatus Kuenenia stuttgartiensis]|uniref:Uncharacterized protein n=1 Tax=Kuenenia stuttgartiensis TaxID=174633 RepID=Q1Q4N5_KUEST|nr:hypothetical protein KsCSTR_32580 [Candidatus Kuenenia stuttgartiensis]CAJ74970.1 unknown protein [Candidatus Kuenenia stuttgartiensis]
MQAKGNTISLSPQSAICNLQFADCIMVKSEMRNTKQIPNFNCSKPGFFHWDFVFLNLFRTLYFVLQIFYLTHVWFWLYQLRY